MSDRTAIPSNSNFFVPITQFAYRLNGQTLVSGGQSGARDNERGVNLDFSPGATSLVDHVEFNLSAVFTYDPPVLDVSVDPSHPWVSVMGAVDGSYSVTFQPGTYTVTGGERIDIPAVPYRHATLTVSPVPEPSTLALAGTGAVLAAAGVFLRRQGRGERPGKSQRGGGLARGG